jgi:hypothetical protein
MKRWIRIVIIAIILLILAMLPWLFFDNPQQLVDKVAPKKTDGTGTAPVAVPVATKDLTVKPAEQFNFGQIAMQFAERFGSYSSETDHTNLKDLMPQATTEFQTTLGTIMKTPVTTGGEFYGVTTRSLFGKTDNKGETGASVIVTTQREETKGAAKRVYNQNIRIVLRKVNTDWLIHMADWQPLE